MEKITSDKKFSEVLGGFLRSQKSQRDNLQSLIVYGLEKYQAVSDTSQLTAIVQGLNLVKTVPAKTIKEYIKIHANVKLVKDKAGNLVFKKEAKGADVPAQVKMPEVTWYDWQGNNANQAKADIVDPVAVLKAAMIKIKEALDEGKIVEGRDGQAMDWLERLRDVGNFEAFTPKQLKEMSIKA